MVLVKDMLVWLFILFIDRAGEAESRLFSVSLIQLKSAGLSHCLIYRLIQEVSIIFSISLNNKISFILSTVSTE